MGNNNKWEIIINKYINFIIKTSNKICIQVWGKKANKNIKFLETQKKQNKIKQQQQQKKKCESDMKWCSNNKRNAAFYSGDAIKF